MHIHAGYLVLPRQDLPCAYYQGRTVWGQRHAHDMLSELYARLQRSAEGSCRRPLQGLSDKMAVELPRFFSCAPDKASHFSSQRRYSPQVHVPSAKWLRPKPKPFLRRLGGLSRFMTAEWHPNGEVCAGPLWLKHP